MSSCLAARLLRPINRCTLRSFSTESATQSTPSVIPKLKCRQSRNTPYLYRHLKEGPLKAPVLKAPELPKHSVNVQADKLKAHYQDGQWKRAKISAMTLARERKVALARGEEFEFQRREPLRKAKPVVMKGHKHERNALARKARVEQAMKEMPARIEEYYKQLHARRKEDSQALRLLGATALNNLAGKTKGKKSKKKQQAQ